MDVQSAPRLGDLVLHVLAADLTVSDSATLQRELRERSLLGEARLTALLGDETAVRRLALRCSQTGSVSTTAPRYDTSP